MFIFLSKARVDFRSRLSFKNAIKNTKHIIMKKSNIIMLIAAILPFGLFLFPLWKITLEAPQYPTPLGMYIHINDFSDANPHDIKNIFYCVKFRNRPADFFVFFATHKPFSVDCHWIICAPGLATHGFRDHPQCGAGIGVVEPASGGWITDGSTAKNATFKSGAT